MNKRYRVDRLICITALFSMLFIIASVPLVQAAPSSTYIERAITWAKLQKQRGVLHYSGLCGRFVGDAYASHFTQYSAGDYWRSLPESSKNYDTNAPRGSFVFFQGSFNQSGGAFPGQNVGHVAISLGGGQVIHALNTGVTEQSIASYGGPYWGWAWPGGNFEGINYPTGALNLGDPFYIRYMLAQPTTMNSCSAGVFYLDGSPTSYVKTWYPNSNRTDVKANADAYIMFRNLPIGAYRFILRTTLSSGSTVTEIDRQFTIGNYYAVEEVILGTVLVTLNPGEQHAIGALVWPDNATNPILAWSSNNSSIASVDSQGNVTAHTSGIAIISAVSQDNQGIMDSCEVIVQPKLLSSIYMSESVFEALIGINYQLVTSVLPADATNKALTWSSSNLGVAAVDQTGQVVGIAPGYATITATAQDGSGVSATATVTVLNPTIYITGIQLTPPTLDIKTGKVKGIVASILSENATNKALTWSSSNPGIASVNASGQVTGVAPGTAVITATAQDGSNVSGSMTVKVSMPAPVISTLGASGMTATLKWGAVTGAQSYQVYRSVNGGASAFLKGTMGTTISDPGLVVGNSYTYCVQANGPGGSKSEMSTVRSVTLKLAAPVISSLSASGTTATLRWSAVAGAESYYVYRSVNGRAFAFLKGTTGAQINDTGLAGGNWVSYRVRANANSGAVSAISSAKGITVLAAPVISSLGANGTTATLKWKAVSGAASYYVYRSVNGGAYAFLKGTTGITVNDPGLTVGSSYYYKVRANGSGGNESALSALKGIKIDINLAAPVINSLNVSGTTAALSWGKVTYAESYYVYRSVNGGAFAFLKGTTGTTVNDSGLVGGNSYAYQVQANGPGGTKSAQSATKTVTLKLATPVISSLSTNGTTTATLIWGAVPNAVSYYIYRAVNGAGFTFLKGTTATNIKDAGLVAGKSYAYRLQANGPGSTKSDMSVVKSFLLK